QPYGFNTRFEDTPGTNPEELLGAAHASCFAMALSMILGQSDLTPDSIETTATVHLEEKDGGYHVPKNTNCLLPVYYIHRDPKYWDEPLKFKPERFNAENSKGRHKFVYFPFGGGPRLCIGNNFALMEMQLVVPMLVRAYSLKKAKCFEFKKEPLVTMRPSPHLKMVINKR
ncbi:MAG: cytochrome P450, partial [Flavobacteriales bacterium]